MGKIMEVEASQIRQELRQELREYKSEQEKVITSLAANVEKLTEVVTEIRVYQAELNSVSGRITSIESDVKMLTEKQSDTNGKLAVASDFVKSANKLMWGVAILIVGVVIKFVMDAT
jgi:chromosome segregation ATPase